MTEVEEQKTAADFLKEEVSWLAETSRVADRLIKTIRSVKGDVFADSVIECMEESEINEYYKVEIVSETVGGYQEEDYEGFKGIWVQQWSVGDSGDSWEGYVCIQIKSNKYLKFRYSM